MSATSGIIHRSKSMLEDFAAYIRLAKTYLKKKRPVKSIYVNLINGIKNVLTANKKLKIARYRVNHLRYRMHQMETLIQSNNPNNFSAGRNLNQLR